jgi:rRNA-processing protein FCF1
MPTRHLVVDGANVVGSRPDGWWRDRAGAAGRLAAQLSAALDAGMLDTDEVHLVLEGVARKAEVPDHTRLHVVLAPADGDSAIVELAAALDGDVTVVTADRGLRDRLSVTAVGPGTLLSRLT